MAYEEWVNKYQPIENTFDEDAPFNGTMFETYGDEIEVVRATNQEYVWTLIEEDGKQIICPGYRYVNRIGYFITQNKCRSSNCIEINNPKA